MSARAKPPPEGERFADLVRDARPLAEGPARADDRSPARGRASGARARPGASERATTGAAPGFRHPDPECAHLAGAPGVSDLALARLRRADPEPEERIDLHGTRRGEAKRILAMRIESAVVHGVGRRSPNEQAVLRDAIPGWLESGANARHVLAFAPAPRRLGGDGATLVLLRKPGRNAVRT